MVRSLACAASRCYYSASITLNLRLMVTPPIELVSLLQLCDPLIGRKKSISDKVKRCQHSSPPTWELLDDNKAFISFEATSDSMASLPAIENLVHVIKNVLVSKGATGGSIELITYIGRNKFTYRFKLSGLTFFLVAMVDYSKPNDITQTITITRGSGTGVLLDSVNIAHSLYTTVRTMLVSDLNASKRRVDTENAKINSITKTLALF